MCYLGGAARSTRKFVHPTNVHSLQPYRLSPNNMASGVERHSHIVPWNNTAELLWVKRAFFPEEGCEDERGAALAKVFCRVIEGALSIADHLR